MKNQSTTNVGNVTLKIQLDPMTPRGNLLMVSNYPSDTAYAWWLMEHFWVTLAEQFNQVGCKAYLAYPRITTLSKSIAAAPIEPIQLSIPWQSRQQASLARDFIHDKNITSIYLTDQPYFNPQYAMMRLSGVRRIIVHDHTPGDRPAMKGIKGTLKATRNAMSWLTADNVLCVSELMRRRNISNGRISADKCIVVPNGIRPVICAEEKRNALRESLGVRPSSILAVTTGRAHPYKRFDFIINIAGVINNSLPELDIAFILVGDGPAMPELRDQVRNLGLEDVVRLPGFYTDVRGLLCASDIAVHAALGEGFSLSIIEYMSAGLPVLVPDIPSVSQAVDHNATGIIYPKDNVEAAASDLQSLATDHKRRLAMGRAAKAKANSAYNLERCTQSFIAAIHAGYRLCNSSS